MSQILYQLRIELALFYFSIETNFVKFFEHFLNMLVVYRHVIRVDEYIIKVDYNTNIQKIRKYDVHELPEDYGSIGKIK